MKRISVWTAALLVLIAVVATLGAVRLRESLQPAGYTADAKLEEALAVLRAFYIGERDEEAMADAAVGAMVQNLGDRWSYYMTAEETQDYEKALENAYQGLGLVMMALPEGGAEIQTVHRQSPAGEAGILPGSRLMEADDVDLSSAKLEEAMAVIRTSIEAGQVTLKLVCPDGETRSYTLIPGLVETDPVQSTLLESGFGLITISNFEGRSAEQAIAAVEALRGQGAAGLIFDVRNNPGGQLNELLKLLDYLLPEGTLFISKAIDGTVTNETSDAACVQLPMAVLLNGNSYSAAEFFAAALREYDWAELVGEQTSGKGRAQVTVYLHDGSAIHISNIEYFTPKGVSLANVGLTPDIITPLSDEAQTDLYYGMLDPAEDAQLAAAQQALLAVGAAP